MAEIRPIRAWRYNADLSRNIEQLTSPLFDVVSAKQRQALYKNPFNSVHLSVPNGSPQQAAHLLSQWKEQGVIVQDDAPGIYVYYQYFNLPGSDRTFCRKGFICHIRAYEFEAGVIRRHENTIPSAVNDRTDLLRETRLHVSPTHGLYTDPDFVLEKFMDEAIRQPVYETEDYQGVRDVLAVITDPKVVFVFLSHLYDKTIILADGHHRYESSLEYKREMVKAHPDAGSDAPWHFHLMYLTNTEADDLRILPTHRLIQQLEHFDTTTLMERVSRYFDVREVADPDTLGEVIQGKPWTFGLYFNDSAWRVRLKPECLTQNHWPFPEVIKELDLTVMHCFLIEKVLGIPGRDQRSSPHIAFDRSLTDCLTRVMRGEAQLAIITREVSIEDVKRVCASGFTMPQKSTYFYPKVICGFLFSSIRDDEQ